MTLADDTSPKSEEMTQADAEPVSEHNQARRNFFATRQHHALTFVTRRYFGDLGIKALDAGWNLRAHGIDPSVVHHAVLIAGLFYDNETKPRFLHLAVEGRRLQYLLVETRVAQSPNLSATELFAAQVG